MSSLEDAAARHALRVAGACAVERADGLPDWAVSLVMLSPDEPAFWPHLQSEPEASDGLPDPIDRWSARVLSEMAAAFDGLAVLPFGGPPYWPFYLWALRSGRAFASPVSLLVDTTAGLFASYRGAIALPFAVDLPPQPNPCDSCADKPCVTACPAAALGRDGYDVPACHGFLDTDAGQTCLTGGCHVRRACPVGQGRRLPAQSAHHMKVFHP